MLVVMLLLLSILSAFLSVKAHAAPPLSNAVTAIPVGPYPISFGYSPADGYVYVGSFTGGISVISGTSVVGNFSSNDIGYLPRAFAYDSSNQEEYVAAGNRLSLISGVNMVANGPNGGATPQAVVYDSSDGYIFVANLGSIVVLSSSNALEANITAYARPGGLVYDPLDDYTYASYIIQNGTGVQTGTEVYVMSGAHLVGNVTLANGGGGFVPPVYDSCRNYVYLANTNLGSVSVIWGTTLVGAVPAGLEPAALAYDESNHYVYVANSYAGTVSVLNGTEVVGNVNVGSMPNAIAYDPHDGYVYVVNEGSASVSVISGTTLMETVNVGEAPVAIIYNPSNNDMYVANNGAGTVSVIPSVGPPVSNGSSPDCNPIRAAHTKTTTTVTCATPVTVATPSSCSVTVTGYGTPSGMISTFTSTGSGTFDATSCTLSGGTCTLHYTPASVSGSPHLISATYEGDTNNNASTSTGGDLGSVTVNQATTATSLSCSSPVTVGTPSTCTVTVLGAYGTTAGEMISVIASGSGSFDATSCSLSAGSCTVHYTPTSVAGSPQTITGAYPGDTNNAGNSGTASVTVNKVSATTTVNCASPDTVGAPSTCSVTVTGYGAPSGSASFKASGSGTFSSGGACIPSGGTCSVTYTPTSASGSPQTITGAYSGDTNNAGSSGTASVTVTQATTTTSVSCTYPGANLYTCTASVSGAAATISGETITFSQTGGTGSVTLPSPATCTLSGASCQIAVMGSSSGPATIEASYGGDTNNAGSFGTASIPVNVTTTVPPVTIVTSSSSSSSTSTQTPTVGPTGPSTPVLSTPVLLLFVIFVVLAGLILLVRRRSART
jgi:YVTN family beta-propeller protein